ncbi:MAG: endonuclease/exonuclease/phosphatase family protein [Candidatus Paceibacterota bacterium]
MNIRLISVNMEEEKHITRLLSFFEAEKPDCICFQEILESRFEAWKHEFRWSGVYAKMLPCHGEYIGVGILSRIPVHEMGTLCFHDGDRKHRDQSGHAQEVHDRVLPYVTYTTAGDSGQEGNEAQKLLTVFSTHLPRNENGSVISDFQKTVSASLKKTLASRKNFILCGDINAPRGTEVFDSFSEIYKDCIPEHYKTSIDANLHRAGALPYMVDGLFNNSFAEVSDVSLCAGVSDHMAVCATIRI